MGAGQLTLVDATATAEPTTTNMTQKISIARAAEGVEPITDDKELILQEHWELWQDRMRADAPHATDDYLRNTALRAFLFHNDVFEAHRRNMVEIIASKPAVPLTVLEEDLEIMTAEEHDAMMRERLDDENYAKYRAGVDNPTIVEREDDEEDQTPLA